MKLALLVLLAVLFAAPVAAQPAGPGSGSAIVVRPPQAPTEVKPGVNFDLGGGRVLRTMAGSGGVVVMDDTTDIPKATWRIMKFFAHESCGQCTPCREGTGWLEKVARRVGHGQGKEGDIDLMASIAHGIAGNTICALGDAAAWPMLGFLTKFRADFEAKIVKVAA